MRNKTYLNMQEAEMITFMQDAGSFMATYMNGHGQRKLWSTFKGNKNNGDKRRASSAVKNGQYEQD